MQMANKKAQKPTPQTKDRDGGYLKHSVSPTPATHPKAPSLPVKSPTTKK